MRDLLRPYSGPDRLNYLCLFAMQWLGARTLAQLPVLLSGHRSVTRSTPDIEQLVHHLRLNGLTLTTERSLQLFIEQYQHLHAARLRLNDGAGMPQRFRIDASLRFEPLWGDVIPADVTEALVAMARTPDLKARAIPPRLPADSTGEIRLGEAKYNGHVSALGFEPPAPPVVDHERLPVPPRQVRWSDLVEQARVFDRADVVLGRQAAGADEWYHRLYDEHGRPKVELQSPGEGGLETVDAIDLVDVKHLIGLPGAGKTTLLTLLAAVLERREHRACFLFPSIEVAAAFLETLDRYHVRCGLLYGQSEAARTRHVENFATAVGQTNGGFGVTRAVAMNYATNCTLSAWASDEEQPFPHQSPPCLAIESKGAGNRLRKHQCALSGACGRQQSERGLVEANIWAGHILSTDRRVSPLYCGVDLRVFELLARSFDLVVLDEADGAQAALDERGTAVMRLVSADNTLTDELLQSIPGRVIRGSNAFVAMDRMGSIIELAGRFITANSRLVNVIQRMRSDYKKGQADKVLTTASLLSDMFPAEEDLDDAQWEAYQKRRQAFERVWDLAAKRVAYREVPGDEDEDDPHGDGPDAETERLAVALGISSETVVARIDAFEAALRAWDVHPAEDAMAAVVRALRDMPNFTSPLTDEQFADLGALLTGVSQVILQFFGLAPFLRILQSAGLIEDNVFESRPSVDMLRLLPESLLGKMAGLRYSIEATGDVHLQHVAVAGVPRLLPQRIADLGRLEGRPGPAVLLTSATSMLAPSPSYHVDVGPHYLLRRPDAGRGWERSEYRLLPLESPFQPDRPLRFSGASAQSRDAILRAMCDRLVAGGAFSPLRTALDDNDIHDSGVGRRAAFVLNSYEQCQLLHEHLNAMHPEIAQRTRCLVRGGTRRPNTVTAAEVETLGRDPDWELLLFPMGAIGRGVNIVYQFGARSGDAMLGSLFFLTRPHPRGDSLQLMQGLAGRASATFDQRASTGNLDTMLALHHQARVEALQNIRYLMRLPLQASRLGRLAEPFVADQMVAILQTIGRAMRNDCPAFAYFVDAAWAPRSSAGQRDTPATSMLVMMQKILRELLAHPDASTRMFYENLYAPFYRPLSTIGGLLS